MNRPGEKTIGEMSHSDLTQFIGNILASQNPDKSTAVQQVDVHDVLNVKDKIRLSPQAKAYIFQGSGVTPAGGMIQYGGTVAPAGWLLCDGTSYLRTDYPALFSAIGTAYGSVDGTHFTVPDLRGRIPVGKNAATFAALGGTGGEETHTLLTAEMPSHNHGSPITTSAVSAGTPAGSLSSDSAGTPTGTNTAVSAGTPAGTVSQPTFTGSALAGHAHTSPVVWSANNTATGAGKIINDVGGITAATGTAGTLTVSSVSAGTPAGTVSQPTFTGSALGTHNHTFTGNAMATHTHTFTGSAMGTHTHTVTLTSNGGDGAHNNLQPYVVVNYLIKS